MTPWCCRYVVAGSVTCMMFCNLCELCGLSMAAVHAAWIWCISCGCCTSISTEFVHHSAAGSICTDMISCVSFRSLSSTICKISHLLTALQRVLKASESDVWQLLGHACRRHVFSTVQASTGNTAPGHSVGSTAHSWTSAAHTAVCETEPCRQPRLA